MDTAILLSQMIQMFLMLALGYILRKTGFLDGTFTSSLTRLLLNVTMPCVILHSVISQTGERNLQEVGQVFLIAAILMILLPFVCLLVVKLLHFPASQQGLYAFMLTYPNVGFMGFPLISALYGSQGVFYTSIINIMFNISCFTLGLSLMHYGSGRRAVLNAKMFLTPGVILSLLALLFYLLNLSFPDEIISVTESIGNINTPVAMLCLGSTLASMSWKEVLSDRYVYLFSVIKQIALPLVLLMVFRLFLADSSLLGILYVLMLTPTGNSAVLFATQYHFDEKLAARGTFVTTLLSLVTIPLLGVLL